MTRARPLLVPLILAAMVGLAVLLVGASNGRTEDPTVSGKAGVSALLADVPQANATLGRADAPHLLVMYADPFCVGCTDFYDRVLPVLVDRYVRPGRLRLQLRLVNTPGMKPVALREAMAASLQDRLWNFLILFDANAEATVDPVRVAGAIPGVDAERLQRDAGSSRVTAAIRKARRRAKKLGAPVPSFWFDPAGNDGRDVKRFHLSGEAAEDGLRTLERRLDSGR